MSKESLEKLGNVLAMAARNDTTTKVTTATAPTMIAFGDHTMGYDGILAFTKGIQQGGGTTNLQHLDLSWKGLYVYRVFSHKDLSTC